MLPFGYFCLSDCVIYHSHNAEKHFATRWISGVRVNRVNSNPLGIRRLSNATSLLLTDLWQTTEVQSPAACSTVGKHTGPGSGRKFSSGASRDFCLQTRTIRQSSRAGTGFCCRTFSLFSVVGLKCTGRDYLWTPQCHINTCVASQTLIYLLNFFIIIFFNSGQTYLYLMPSITQFPLSSLKLQCIISCTSSMTNWK